MKLTATEAPAHDFNSDLSYSMSARQTVFMEAVYHRAFPTVRRIEDCSGNLALQMLGIDRRLHLSSGQVLSVDEKVRRVDYDDILLEFISVDTPPMKPGWIRKNLAIDYLAYGFEQSKRCYLLPWHMLKKAWRENYQTWFATCPQVQAVNRTYSTWSLAIDCDVIFAAVTRAQRIDL